jgi:chemotaxis protein methyltransferase CheR
MRDPQPGSPSAPAPPELTATALARIAELAHREAGLHIPPAKAAMVRTRLIRRLRLLRCGDFDAYCDLVDSPAGRDELATMISSLTTNVSHFFRENHHFEVFRAKALPALIDAARGGRRVRIWSAGCSNGQEPYSIAMTMLEAGMPRDADVRVLGTDIDPNVVNFAKAAQYPGPMLANVPDHLRDRYFDPIDADPDGALAAGSALRDITRFRVLNLISAWPMRGQFDAIFCRNVVIYFDQPTQDRLWPRFARALNPDGWLFLGHSERVSEHAGRFFRSVGITAYERTSAEVPASTPELEPQ